MGFDIERARQLAASLNAAFEPHANRPVDINDPDWETTVARLPDPLDEAGVRLEAEGLLLELLGAYAAGDPVRRADIRKLFADHPAFVWATGVREPATTLHGFRLHLLRLSAENGCRDLRDTIMEATALCAGARKAGLDVSHVVGEVAAISSAEVVNGMDSLRAILSRCHLP